MSFLEIIEPPGAHCAQCAHCALHNPDRIAQANDSRVRQVQCIENVANKTSLMQPKKASLILTFYGSLQGPKSQAL